MFCCECNKHASLAAKSEKKKKAFLDRVQMWPLPEIIFEINSTFSGDRRWRWRWSHCNPLYRWHDKRQSRIDLSDEKPRADLQIRHRISLRQVCIEIIEPLIIIKGSLIEILNIKNIREVDFTNILISIFWAETFQKFF